MPIIFLIGYLILSFLWLPKPLSGQKMHVQQYTVSDGLAYDHVSRFWQDRQGYLWIATDQGLSRFDGLMFKNFYHDRRDTQSLIHNQIKHVREDRQGYIWVVTSNGLSRYDPRTERFKNYGDKPGAIRVLPTHDLRSINIDDQNNTIWLGTLNKGLIQFDPETGESTTHLLAPSSPYWRSPNTIDWILQDKGEPNRLWLATQKGLYSFDKKKHSFTFHPMKGVDGEIYISVKSLVMEKPGEIWCGTWDHGLIHYRTEEKTAQSYIEKLGGDSSVMVVRTILPLNEKELLIGTYKNGLQVFDKQKRSFRPIKYKKSNVGLERAQVINIYRDRLGTIWIATGKKGVFAFDLRKKPFKKLPFPNKSIGNLSLQDAVISDAEYIPETEQIITTFHKNSICGLNIYEPQMSANHLIPFPYQKKNELVRQHFITRDSMGDLYTSFYGKLFKINLKEKRFIPVYKNLFDKLSNPPFELTKMVTDHRGHIWLAAGYEGIIEIAPEADTLYKHLFDPYYSKGIFVFDIVEGPYGKMWIGTNFGLFSIQKDESLKEKSHRLNYVLKEEMIVDLFADEKGNIWCAGQAQGIKIVSADSAKIIKSISRSDGLPSDITRGIAQVQNADFLIATTGGLAYIDAETENIRTFSRADGLDPFRCENIKLLSNGLLLLYNDNIPSYCYVEDLRIDSNQNPLIIESLWANNKKVDLNPSVNFQNHVELSHSQNVISINFAAISYTEPQKLRYAYRLKGVNEEWQYTSGANRSANFANLSPGKYLFQLKSANADGVWGADMRELAITIHPPWWATTLAYVLYGIAIVALLYLIYRFQLRKKMLQEEARHFREMDAFKTRFYTNITHEFRTPITVIQGMAQQLMGNAKSKKLILRNSKQLLNLVNQMLDLSKLEEGKLPLHKEQGDIVAFLNYLTESMQSLATKKDIQLVFYTEEQRLSMAFDPDKIQQIIQNLLTNAIKFTPKKGKVILHLRREVDHLKLTVQDTGKGIPTSDLPNVFRRYYQSENRQYAYENSGTGVGLALVKELVDLMNGQVSVESTVGKGSRFTVQLPIEKTTKPLPTPETIEKPSIIPASDIVVLIIDDNSDVVTYLQEYLKGQYKVETATNGQEGINKALTLVPDIILCDVMMPVKDGYEVAKILKDDFRTSHIPIIMLTAKAAQEDRIEGLRAGVEAYLVKPFEHKELDVRLQKILEQRRKLQERYASGLPETQMPSKDDVFLRKIYDYIHQEIDNEQLSVHDISRHMNLSRMQVHRKLKALIGQSTTELMRSIRFKKARYLLEETDMNISEVAYAVGYSDPNYFTRQFVANYNITPSDIRKS